MMDSDTDTDTELAIHPCPGVAAMRSAGAVRVRTSARLHLGFLDPAGTLGRRYGSLGLMVDGLGTQLQLAPGREDRFTAHETAEGELPRAREHIDTLRRATGCNAPLRLHIQEALPVHAGLGSGTQLALALGHAFCGVFGLSMASAELARLLGRGLRSGVGIAGFDHGGLLLDGGPRADGLPASILSRIELPPAWRVILVLDGRLRGLSGAQEKSALAGLPPLPRETAAEICHEVLMRVLPGAAGAEFDAFAAGLTQVQRLLGRHFAPAQSGRMFTSADVGMLLEWIDTHASAAIGQSSWGPTGFAIVPSAQAAHAAIAAARDAHMVDPALTLKVVCAK